MTMLQNVHGKPVDTPLETLDTKDGIALERWRRDNAEALSAMDRRIDAMHETLKNLSAVPIPNPDDEK